MLVAANPSLEKDFGRLHSQPLYAGSPIHSVFVSQFDWLVKQTTYPGCLRRVGAFPSPVPEIHIVH